MTAKALLLLLLAALPALGQGTDDAARARRLVELLLDRGRLAEAEVKVLDWRGRAPEDPGWLELLARLRSAQGRSAEAAAEYRRLLALEGGGKPATLKLLGLELLYAGDLAASRETLEKAGAALPADPDVAYALSEVAAAQGRKADARLLAEAALKLLPASADPENERRRLRLRARLSFDAELSASYRALWQRSAGRPGVLVDWTEALLEDGRARDADEPLKLLEGTGAAGLADWRRLQGRALVLRRDWTAAAAHLEAWSAAAPADPRPRRDLGEALWRLGKPRAAERALLPLEAPGDPNKVRDLLRETRHDGGVFFGPTYRYYELPSETSVETGGAFRAPLGGRFKLEAEAAAGRYRVPARGFDRRVRSGEARLAWEPRRGARLGASAGGAEGSLQDRISPGGFAELVTERLQASASYRRRRFWSEFAEAVSAGTLADEAKASVETRPWRRVYMNARYQYNQYRPVGGSLGRRVEAVPAAGVVLSEAPSLTAGYQFVYDDADGADAFFTQLPLVRRARTHYATLYAGHRFWGGRVLLEGYLYNGEDKGRGLRFLDLDAVGGGASLHWEALRRLCVVGDYAYGRQSATGLVGEGHLVSVRLETRLF